MWKSWWRDTSPIPEANGCYIPWGCAPPSHIPQAMLCLPHPPQTPQGLSDEARGMPCTTSTPPLPVHTESPSSDSPGSSQGAPPPAAEPFSAAMVQRRARRLAVGGSSTHGPGRIPAPGGAVRGGGAGKGGGEGGRGRRCRLGPVVPPPPLSPAPRSTTPTCAPPCPPQTCGGGGWRAP